MKFLNILVPRLRIQSGILAISMLAATVASAGLTQIPGSLVKVAVGKDGSMWGLNSSGGIYSYLGGSWKNVPGGLQQISVGNANQVWGINSGHFVYHYNQRTLAWDNIPGVSLSSISAAADGTVFGLDASGNIYQYQPSAHNFKLGTGRLAQISVGGSTLPSGSKTAWGLDANGGVYQYNFKTNSWTPMPGNLSQISVAADGMVVGINKSSQTFRWNYLTNSWLQIPGALVAISTGGGDLTWGYNSSGQIFQYIYSSNAWQPVGNVNVAINMATSANGTVVVLNANQQIFSNVNALPAPAGTAVLTAGVLSQSIPTNSNRTLYFIYNN